MALSKIDVANMVTGAVPVANGGTALTSGFINGNAANYTLVDVKSYTETDQYTTTSSTNQFTCTDQSLNFTTTAQTNGADLILIHGSLNAHSNADNNGYGLFMVHSTSSDFSSGTSTTLQTGRYGEQLMNNEYRNTTGLANLTGLTANTTYYIRMFAMIQRPSSGTITLNVDGYATSASVRHGVIVQQFEKNPS
tara:strand:- start:40 stop:621 length:582 start_codon:yes stop_codon:yes gene_type:complete